MEGCMKKLIEALELFAKYKDLDYPTHCAHDTLCVVGITLEEVSATDRERLEVIGFIWSSEYDSWVSYRYGSA
jgi:hypothetical protein